MAEAHARVAAFTDSLPSEVSVAALGVMEKAPFIAMCLRESLCWRVEELGRNAVRALDQDDIATSTILARCVTEAAAMMWRLRRLVEEREGREPGALHEDLSRMWLGWKGQSQGLPEAVNVLTLIDKLDREIPKVRKNYDMLSEVAHPNWSGVARLYCRTDRKNHTAHFCKAHRTKDVEVPASLLCAALGVFEHAYNGMADLVPVWLSELTPIWPDEQVDSERAI